MRSSQVRSLYEALGHWFELPFAQLYLLHTALASALAEGANQIADVCGSNPDVIVNLAYLVAASACSVATALLSVADLFTCRNIQSLYAIIAYKAICYDSNNGFSWIATTQFLIVFFSMIMLTLRVAFKEIGDELDEKQITCCRRVFCCQRARKEPVPEAALTDANEMDGLMLKEEEKRENAEGDEEDGPVDQTSNIAPSDELNRAVD